MVLRIFKIIATIGSLTALECIIFVFGRGSAQDPTKGVYSALSDNLAGLKGPTSKAEKHGIESGKRKKKGNKREREGPPPFANSWIRP